MCISDWSSDVCSSDLMFKLIGINLIFDLLNDEWFGWMLAGAAFGGAVGLLRERDRLVATLQRLVMIVLAVLAPVLAVALVLFLLSLAGTGLQKLWDSGFSTARSEEHTSELQSLMRISYAVFCLK